MKNKIMEVKIIKENNYEFLLILDENKEVLLKKQLIEDIEERDGEDNIVSNKTYLAFSEDKIIDIEKYREVVD